VTAIPPGANAEVQRILAAVETAQAAEPDAADQALTDRMVVAKIERLRAALDAATRERDDARSELATERAATAERDAEIERLTEEVESSDAIRAGVWAMHGAIEAENARLRSAATRTATVLNDLIEYATDPGVEALGARWELRHALGRTCAPGELTTPAPVSALYPPRVEWVVQVHDPESWEAERDGWEQVGPAYPTRWHAHDRADRRRACRDEPAVRVVAVERTYTLDTAEGAAELPAAPYPTTEDYRFVVRGRPAAGGSTVRTLAEAEQQMATRRQRRPDSPPMAIYRREQVWSVVADETHDASAARESAREAPGATTGDTL